MPTELLVMNHVACSVTRLLQKYSCHTREWTEPIRH